MITLKELGAARSAGRRGWRTGLCVLALALHAGAADVGRAAPDFAALAKRALVTLPPPPAWIAAAGAPSWSVDEVQAEFAKFTDTPPRVNMLRTRLLRPDQRWMTEFVRWFRAVQKPLKIEFHDQAWDCDDYADCFTAFADLLVMKAGGSHSGLCIGRASVYYQRAFKGVRANTAHALVMVGTSEGFFLIDPQDGMTVALREFPNRNTIEEVNF